MKQLLTPKQSNSIRAVVDGTIKNVINTLSFKLAHRATYAEVEGEKCQDLVNALLETFVELKDKLLTDKSYRRGFVLEAGKYNVMMLQNLARFKGLSDDKVDEIPAYLSRRHDECVIDIDLQRIISLAWHKNKEQNRASLKSCWQIGEEGEQYDCAEAFRQSVEVIIGTIADDSFLCGDYKYKRVDSSMNKEINDLCDELVDEIFDTYLGKYHSL